MAESKKPTHPLATVSGIAGAAGGWILSRYAGASLWIPLLGTIVLLLIFTKTPLRPKYFAGAIAATGGHILWFIAASIVLHDWAPAGLDIVVLSIGIAWLWLRPNLAPVLFLGLAQLGSLAYNVFQFTSAPFGSASHKALTVHCIWRLIAIACLVVGYLTLRRERAASACPPPLDGSLVQRRE